MDISEVIAAISGPTAVPHQPEGDPNAQPLQQLGLDRVGAEAAPATPNAQQGAGSGGYLTPGQQGTAAEGVLSKHYVPASGTPGAPLSGIAGLTSGVVNRPEGGAVANAAPQGGPQAALGGDQGEGFNPMLKPAGAPKSDGLFGKPSV
jgi:hypothetical protein